MERKIIENGTTFRWHNSKEELPNLKNEKDTLTCVVKRNGCLSLSVWTNITKYGTMNLATIAK